ncbi:MAG: hypothetical protein LBC67_07075 [Spirochaetales bacterium]|jgi:hypothetical protein|nr:hypothetical protein [Spirochaetales bacterium]
MRRFFCLVVLLGLFLGACSDITQGVFYDIETEISVPDNSLTDDIDVTRVVYLPAQTGALPPTSQPRYYIAGGAVFYREAPGTSDTDWHQITAPGIVIDIAFIGPAGTQDIYAATERGLFCLPASNGYTVFETRNYNTTGKQISRLMSLSGNLFVATFPEGLYYMDGTGALLDTGLTGHRILSGVHTTTGEYLFTSRSTHIFAANSPPSPGGWTTPPLATEQDIDTIVWPVGGSPVATNSGLAGGNISGEIRDIMETPSTPGTLYAVTTAGYVLRSTDSGASWGYEYHGSTFFSIAEINSVLVLGVDGSGLRHFLDPFDPAVPTKSRMEYPPGDFLKIPDLYNSSVFYLMTDTVSGSANWLLTGTNNGVWMADYSNPAYVAWRHE